MQFLRKNNTEVFFFAQFLRCVPNFAARSEGGLQGPPPPSILMERNWPVQLGLTFIEKDIFVPIYLVL